MQIYNLLPCGFKRSTLQTIYSISTIIIVLSTQVAFVAARQEPLLNQNIIENNFDKLLKRDVPNTDTDSKPQKSETSSVTTKASTDIKSTVANLVTEKVNCSLEINVNKTECSKTKVANDDYFNRIKNKMADNKDMLLRTLYVTLGITGIVVLYFVSRAIWLRRKRTKARKYRIIAQNGDRDLEMEPLGDGNDDDEDYTVFEVNGRKK